MKLSVFGCNVVKREAECDARTVLDSDTRTLGTVYDVRIHMSVEYVSMTRPGNVTAHAVGWVTVGQDGTPRGSKETRDWCGPALVTLAADVVPGAPRERLIAGIMAAAAVAIDREHGNGWDGHEPNTDHRS